MLELQQRTGCRALLAQKAFSNFDVYPVLAPYLAGTEASGLYESRLGREQLPEKENHVFCAAYRADDFAELLQYADHIVFNSPGQLAQFGPAAKRRAKRGPAGKPQCSTQEAMPSMTLRPGQPPGHHPGPVGRPLWRPPGAAEAAGWPPLPHSLRAGRRRPGRDPESGGGNVRGPAAQDEVGELWRRPPRYPARL